MREDKNHEFKRTLSKTYLKTVCAFANYQTGKIYFGITDEGVRIGVENPSQTALDIENQINDNILPCPDYNIKIEDDHVVVLEVKKGHQTPYCYKNKSYKRHDSSTVETTLMEYKNLVLKSINLSYTEIPSENQSLTFSVFDKIFYNRFGLQSQFPDTFITLELYSQDEGFTNTAVLVSEENNFPGIDIVVYGKNASELKQRHILESCSVFEQIQKAQELFCENYQYEAVDGLYRNVFEKIPLSAFRELLANAIVHREWQISARIKIEFFQDGVQITSPGSLPDGITEEEYISDHHISILRNKTLGLLFLKFGLIENLGSGIPMIRSLYKNHILQPQFAVSANGIRVFLPLLQSAESLNEGQKKLLDLIRLMQPVSSSQLLKLSQMSKSTQQRILKEMIENHIIVKTGNGPSTRYCLP